MESGQRVVPGWCRRAAQNGCPVGITAEAGCRRGVMGSRRHLAIVGPDEGSSHRVGTPLPGRSCACGLGEEKEQASLVVRCAAGHLQPQGRVGTCPARDASRTPFRGRPTRETLRPCSPNKRSARGPTSSCLPPQHSSSPGSMPRSSRCPVISRRSPKHCGRPRAHSLRRADEWCRRLHAPTTASCRRYQRAAAMWPTDPPPSYERFAAALARLHDAAAATRLAAHRCDEARRTVEALLRTSQRTGAS